MDFIPARPTSVEVKRLGPAAQVLNTTDPRGDYGKYVHPQTLRNTLIE